MNGSSLSTIVYKTTVVHTVTYFLIGVTSFFVFNYADNYADNAIANYMRPLDHPLVTAGTLFQILRGALFGVVFYTLRKIYFERERGWLVVWLMLFVVGIVSPFGAAPSSIEGMVYTTLPMWFHLMSFPELIVQSGLLAFVTYYWVNHPEHRWLNRAQYFLFVVIAAITLLGVISKFISTPT